MSRFNRGFVICRFIFFHIFKIIINIITCFYFFETSLMYLYLYFITFIIIIRNSCHCNNIFLSCYDFSIYIVLEILKYIILLLYFKVKYYLTMISLFFELVLYGYYMYLIMKYNTKNKVYINITSNDTFITSNDVLCSICLEDIKEDKFVTNCSHVFHGKCILNWISEIDINKKQVCPYCRTKLNYSLKR